MYGDINNDFVLDGFTVSEFDAIHSETVESSELVAF